MGRRPYDFSSNFEEIDQKRKKCKHCGHTFAGGATRMEAHVKGTTGKGVKPCEKSKKCLQKEPVDFSQQGAKLIEGASVRGSNKRPKTDARAREPGSPPSSCNILYEDMKVEKEIKDHTHQEISLKMGNKEEEPIECRNVTYQGGPLPISNLDGQDHRDRKLIEYALDDDPNLDKSAILVQFPKFHLTREEFITLRPGSCLNEMIINIVVEKLTEVERGKQKGHLNWYFPTTFSRGALKNDLESEDDLESFKSFCVGHNTQETYLSNLKECDKIFIPIHISPNSIGHFYLYVVDVKKNLVEIWDSLPKLSCADIREREQKGQSMLRALDVLFGSHMTNNNPEGWKFAKFDVELAKDIPCQSNGYDCGMFVIKFMQLSTAKRYPSSKFQSDEERLTLALDLLRDDMNTKRERPFEKAERHCHQDKENPQQGFRKDDPDSREFENEDFFRDLRSRTRQKLANGRSHQQAQEQSQGQTRPVGESVERWQLELEVEAGMRQELRKELEQELKILRTQQQCTDYWIQMMTENFHRMEQMMLKLSRKRNIHV